MNVVVFRRPLVSLPSFLLPSVLALCGKPVTRRHESTARRTTKRLRVKPDTSSFGSADPRVRQDQDQDQDHIVFNPPSSTPSVDHTPALFLPPKDPRRQLLTRSLGHANPYTHPDRRLPPPVREPYAKTYHLSEAQIDEIRKLRTRDPYRWTRAKLAEKFECSQFFVGMVCEAGKDRKEQQQTIMEGVKARWGKRRRYAREDRMKRREMWGKDE